jgi:hypothetical protein
MILVYTSYRKYSTTSVTEIDLFWDGGNMSLYGLITYTNTDLKYGAGSSTANDIVYREIICSAPQSRQFSRRHVENTTRLSSRRD